MATTGDRIKDYVDWLVKSTVGGLVGAAIATATWAFHQEQRSHDIEVQQSATLERVITLEARGNSYDSLRSDVAVIQSQIIAQGKSQDRIEALLLRLKD